VNVDFEFLTEELDHPEGVAWSRRGVVYAGGEAGQIYSVELDGSVRQVASTGGEILGLALDGADIVYACDPGNGAVMRIDPSSGSVDVYSSGTASDPMRTPNALCFDAIGNLYVTDSGEYMEHDGVVFRITPDATATVWTRAPSHYPNGCCLDAAGTSVLIAESYRPGVIRVPIQQDGSAGPTEPIVELPDTVPDGIALDAESTLYVTCYRPDRIYRVGADGEAVILADDPHGAVLNAPTNVAFVGDGLDRLVVANVGEWHLLIGDVGAKGLPLRYPTLG